MSQPIVPQQQPVLVQVRQKETGIAYLFWLFLGFVGGHQFYLGKTGRGLLYLFTFGILGVGTLIDLFTLPSQVRQVNTQLAIGIR
jgi:TM2 domain-containing membrane protein YozV